MSDENKIDTNLAHRLLLRVRNYCDLRVGREHAPARSRHYVPVGDLTRDQALSDETWNRMVELGLVDG